MNREEEMLIGAKCGGGVSSSILTEVLEKMIKENENDGNTMRLKDLNFKQL